MSDSVHPPSPSGPSLPALDTAAAPAESSSNAVAAAAAVADAGPSTDVDAVSIPSLSMASSSAPSPSQSSSSQPSPSPSGGAAKYENTKELKTLKEKIANLGAKGNFSEQVEVLRSSEATLIKYYPLLEEFLISLDPLHSTAAIVLALAVMVEGATAKKQDRDMMRASDILKNFVESKVLVKEQLLMVIDIYVATFRRITNFLIYKEEFVNGIPFVSAGIDNVVDPSEQTITSLHGFLFTLCLKAHAIGPGLNYLYPYIRGILSETNPTVGVLSQTDSRPLLTYLYYGALLTARASQWKRSSSLLKAACFVPGYAVSEIQIEALKKLHIISFIAYGRMSIPARSPNLTKAWKQHGGSYGSLAAELEGGTLSDWDDETNSYGEDKPLSTDQIAERAKIVHKYLSGSKKTYEKDQNVELLLILMNECKLRAVIKVAEMYKVASLARITQLAKLENEEETKQVLTALIDGGRLLVSDDGEGFIRLELPVVTQALGDITERQQRLVAISEDVKRLDIQAQKTTWYMQRTNKSGHANDDEGLSMSNVPDQFMAPAAPTSVPM
ncbi:hypothetical protein PENTCL1PPCAC_6418 [Pristionchus entomophagus]|uniref:COP9 signalosome complex subunit 3 N-terminal helical repeats domain-containing protein n=1 Tax=Pristionchus entomophagus TaxID=358040 RepID=A0AAV5SMB6_9BILA|nr:hypothetical protein PENTCL1PPCAC_6418 [Pristionchus entomophagus]